MFVTHLEVGLGSKLKEIDLR